MATPIFVVIALGAIPVAKWPAGTLPAMTGRRQADARLRAGVLWQDNGLVFTTAHGTQPDVTETVYRHQIRPVITVGALALRRLAWADDGSPLGSPRPGRQDPHADITSRR